MARSLQRSAPQTAVPAPPSPNSFRLDAIRYIVDQARKLGRPVSIDPSLRSFTENMDGTDADCTAVDTLLLANSAGTAIVFSAGNDGDAGFHAIGPVAAGPAATLPLKFTVFPDDGRSRETGRGEGNSKLRFDAIEGLAKA